MSSLLYAAFVLIWQISVKRMMSNHGCTSVQSNHTRNINNLFQVNRLFCGKNAVF